MAQLPVNFSSGNLYGVRTDSAIAVPDPVFFGVLQDVSLDFDGQLKELYGQSQFPQDVARGQIKVTGKAKTALIYSQYFDLFFGQGVTKSSGLSVVNNEAKTVPTASPYTVTTTNATASVVDDLGVSYQTTGLPLVKSATASSAGTYSYAGGVYTLNSSDSGAAVYINYDYTSGSGTNILNLSNQLMGTSPTFFIVLSTTFKGNVMNIKLNQCISSKLTIPITNKDYTIFEFDFQAYVDTAGNLGKITTTI